MQIVVIGCGKVGSKFALTLSEEGHDVVIVDNDANNFKALGSSFNGIMVVGVPIDQDVLKQAGIETADALAAVTPDDNVHIMVCQVAKEIFKVPKVIARIYNPAREHVFHEFGLDTMCPTNLTVEVIKSMVLNDSEVSTHTIGSNTFKFKHVKVKGSDEGKSLDSVTLKSDASILGIVRKGRFLSANSEMKLEKNDTIIYAEMID